MKKQYKTLIVSVLAVVLISTTWLFPRVVVAKDLTVRVNARISTVLEMLGKCTDKTALRAFDQAYEQGEKAFFRKVDPKSAYAFFSKAIDAWSSARCSFIAAGDLKRVAQSYVLAVRSLLLLHRRDQARQLAQKATRDVDYSFFQALPLPPNTAKLFQAMPSSTVRLTVETWTRANACNMFVNGVAFHDHIDVAPGQYQFFVACNQKVVWARDVDLQKDTVLKIATGLSLLVKRVAGPGMVVVDASKIDRFLNCLAFCTNARAFGVFQHGIQRQWTYRDGRWQPQPAPVKKAAPVIVARPVRISRQKINVLPIALLSAAVAVAGAGGAFNYLANQATNHINAGHNELSRRRGYTIAAWTSYGVAAGMAITAAVLWGVQGTHRPVSAAITPTGMAVSVSF